jgi:hypothetical protein
MKKEQIISCRLPYQVYDDFEIKCIESDTTMSNILRSAILDFIKKNRLNIILENK